MSNLERTIKEEGRGSLKLILVKQFCDQLGIEVGSTVRQTIIGKQIVIEKVEQMSLFQSIFTIIGSFIIYKQLEKLFVLYKERRN